MKYERNSPADYLEILVSANEMINIRNNAIRQASLQSMADPEKILSVPTVPHFRCGCAKSVQKSKGAPLHYGHHSTNIKASKSEGRTGALS